MIGFLKHLERDTKSLQGKGQHVVGHAIVALSGIKTGDSHVMSLDAGQIAE